jgi:hypothetical protein
MTENLKHKCTRRSGERRIRIEESIPLGAGSGGDDADGGFTKHIYGVFDVQAGGVDIMAHDTKTEAPSAKRVRILGAAWPDAGGLVEVRGDQGVRITTGPVTAQNGPKMGAESTEGVEVVVGDEHTINLVRGMTPGATQSISIFHNSINVLATTAGVLIDSLEQITLQVAGGLSSITLTPSGIVIKGLIVQIN